MTPPSIGRIVHYTNLGSVSADDRMVYPPTQQAFLITWVNDDGTVDGTAFYRGGGVFPMSNVPFSEDRKRGTWSWPDQTP